MSDKTDMNKLLRQATYGFTDEELDEEIARRERQLKFTPMNRLLRMARGIVVEHEEGPDDGS